MVGISKSGKTHPMIRRPDRTFVNSISLDGCFATHVPQKYWSSFVHTQAGFPSDVAEVLSNTMTRGRPMPESKKEV